MKQLASKDLRLYINDNAKSHLFASYLHQEGLLDTSTQSNTTSLFCMDYLLSAPFQSSKEPDKVAEAVKAGFYALQDYATFHVHEMLMTMVGVSTQQINNLDQDLALILEQFIHLYHLQQNCVDESPACGVDQSPEPQDHVQASNTRFFWNEFELKMLLIRDAIEGCWVNDFANTEDRKMMEEIYGTLSFKCPRIGCVHFHTGFESKTMREEHLHRHDRPIFCVEKGCIFEHWALRRMPSLKNILCVRI